MDSSDSAYRCTECRPARIRGRFCYDQCVVSPTDWCTYVDLYDYRLAWSRTDHYMHVLWRAGTCPDDTPQEPSSDILLLGAYYVVVILGYLLFEMMPINYRPILIGGNLEASYPSSTTLLVLSVMPTLKYQSERRIAKPVTRKAIAVFVIVFSAFMVLGRLIAGVHWATDIVGSVFLSSGLFMIYRFMADYTDQKKTYLKAEVSNGV